MDQDIDIRKNQEAHEYQLYISGELTGHATYDEIGDAVVFPSVVISPQVRGKGLAHQLTKFALDDAVGAGKTIDPVCPFVVAYVRRHPEYQQYVATTSASQSASENLACELPPVATGDLPPV